MAWAEAAVWLGAQVGPVLARSITDRLRSAPKADQRIAQVNTLVSAGASAVSAFQRAFGTDFDKVVSELIRNDDAPWVYEAGRSDYIKVDIDGQVVKPAHQTLRDELNINLDRIARLHGNGTLDVSTYFLGAFRQWMERYRELAGNSDDAEQTFEAINGMLDGKRKTFADAFRLLQQTALGTAGALLIVQGVLVATSTGVGAIAAVAAWLVGIPAGQVAALILSGALVVALSRLKLRVTDGMSASVAAAYKLLDRTAKNAQSPKAQAKRNRSPASRGRRA